MSANNVLTVVDHQLLAWSVSSQPVWSSDPVFLFIIKPYLSGSLFRCRPVFLLVATELDIRWS